MNIAVDIQPLTTRSSMRGMGRYTLDLLMEMFRLDKENKYFLFNCYGKCAFDKEELPENVQYFSFYSGDQAYLLSGRQPWENDYEKIWHGLFRAFIKKNNIDTFFLTSAFDELMCYKIEWFDGVNVVIIVYDLIPFIFKKQYYNEEKLNQWYDHTYAFIKKANKLLAISESVRDDLIQYLKINKERIEVIYSGVGDNFKKIQYNTAQKTNLYQKYQMNGNFILFPGGGDYRKNVYASIRAYSQIPQELINKYQLIVTGIVSEEYREKLYEICKEKEVEHRVRIEGYIPEEDLLMMYNCADLVVFTSLYEGFGLPVLEAYQCGTNVLTSNNSSLGEVAKNAAVLVDPFNEGDITRGLIEALTKTDFSLMNDQIKEKLKRYTWSNTARKTLDVLNGLPKKIREKKRFRRRVAFFAPLNPLKSGISDYSEDMIEALSKYCDIDIYIDDGYNPVKKFADNVRIFNHRMFVKQFSLYDDYLYQIGNSSFHLYMFPYIQKYPGTVVFHEHNLHNLLYVCYFYDKKDMYAKYLKPEVEDISEFLTITNMNTVNEIEANRFIADYAKRIIVHSEYARKSLLKKNIGYRIKKIYSYAKIEGHSDLPRLREKYGISQNEFIFASFGQAAVTKRIMPILQAIANVAGEYPNMRYYIVGVVLKEIEEEVNRFISQNGLQEKVFITGYTDMQTFKDYIQMVDVCLNLRYPYYGETSASFMRIMAAGKPAVVTDIGSFGEMPDDCCMKIGHDNEVEDIENCIHKFIKNPELIQYYGQNAQKFAEDHLNIDKIAIEYYDFMFDEEGTYFNDSVLRKIVLNEIIPRGLNEDEIYKLSQTLEYIITG